MLIVEYTVAIKKDVNIFFTHLIILQTTCTCKTSKDFPNSCNFAETLKIYQVLLKTAKINRLTEKKNNDVIINTVYFKNEKQIYFYLFGGLFLDLLETLKVLFNPFLKSPLDPPPPQPPTPPPPPLCFPIISGVQYSRVG